MVPDDLKQHSCICQRLPSSKPYRWAFSKAGQEIAVDVAGTLSRDSSRLMVEAAIAGLGIAFVPKPFARDAVTKRELLLIVPESLKGFSCVVKEQTLVRRSAPFRAAP